MLICVAYSNFLQTSLYSFGHYRTYVDAVKRLSLMALCKLIQTEIVVHLQGEASFQI